MLKYKRWFNEYYFTCNLFGHKATYCESSIWSKDKQASCYKKCYECHNFGHMAKDFRRTILCKPSNHEKHIWRKNEQQLET